MLSGFTYTINQSDEGFLWVGTGNGIFRFDGFNFFKVQYPDSSLLRIAYSSLKDKNGTLWFGCNDGTVYYSKDNSLVQVKLPNEKSISDLVEGSDGLIYVIPQGKAIFSINPVMPDEIHTYTFDDETVMLSAAFAGKHKLLIGTQENLLICNIGKDSVSISGVVDGFDYSAVSAITQTGDSLDFVVGTDGNGLFKLHLSGKENMLTRFASHPEFESLSVQSIIRDSLNNLWISTKDEGAMQITFADNFNKVRIYSFL